LLLGSVADTFTVSEIDFTLLELPTRFMLAVSVTTTLVSVPRAALKRLKVPRLAVQSVWAGPNEADWIRLAGASRSSSVSRVKIARGAGLRPAVSDFRPNPNRRRRKLIASILSALFHETGIHPERAHYHFSAPKQA
jgi:hypothetical protein